MAQLLYKNVASQRLYVLARNLITGAVVTGIAATITGNLAIDNGAFASIGNPTELGNGVYYWALSQANTNGDVITVVSTTTTSNVAVDAAIITTGSATPDVNVAQISGDSAAADNLELFTDGTGYDATNSAIGTLSGNVDGIAIDTVLKILLAALANQVTGANGGAATIVYKDRAGATLLTIETDAYGNRAANGTLVEA